MIEGDGVEYLGKIQGLLTLMSLTPEVELGADFENITKLSSNFSTLNHHRLPSSPKFLFSASFLSIWLSKLCSVPLLNVLDQVSIT